MRRQRGTGMGQFDGKVAIITGPGQGIGAAYAQALGCEGAAVVVAEVADINAEASEYVAKEIVAEGGSAIGVPVDVSEPESARAMAERTVAVRRYRLSGEQRCDLRRHEARLAVDGAVELLQEIHERAPRWGAGVHAGGVQADGPARSPRTTTPSNMVDEMVKSLPLSRIGTPEDLVGRCLFLLSDAASWITGQIFNVDGGQIIRF